MTRVAVVNSTTNVVENIILYEVKFAPFEGMFFVDVDNTPCAIGWVFDPSINDFFNPNPVPSEESVPTNEGG